MTIWIDAQLSPALANWLTARFGVEAHHIKHLGLIPASDPAIFEQARRAGAIVLTKDRDFRDLVRRHGPPPRVVWVTCGNTSNRVMMRILENTFERACDFLASGEAIVEIRG